MAPAKKAEEDVKSVWLKVRVTEGQLERWRAAAEAAKRRDEEIDDFSTWVRRMLSQAAKKETGR